MSPRAHAGPSAPPPLARPVVAVVLLLTVGVPSSGDTFKVTRLTDTVDGTCDADCGLREAVIAANANPGPDRIELGAGVHTLALTGSRFHEKDLDVTDPLEIVGLGRDQTTIDGDDIDRVLELHGGAGAVSISRLTISGGDTAGSGGGILAHGGVELALDDAIVQSNDAGQGGGGLFLSGGSSAVLVTSSVSGNRALGSEAGGGIFNAGTLTVKQSFVTGNSAAYGGGVYNTGTATVTASTLSFNTADDGGAILNYYAPLTLTNSTIAQNVASATGGGLFAYDGVTLVNTTVSMNSPSGIQVSAPVQVSNSIVGANSPSDCSLPVVDQGGNFDSDGSCAVSGTVVSGVDFSPGLVYNGGPTTTNRLLAGSVAIGAAGDCGLLTDQRLALRDDGSCDSGAFEFDADDRFEPSGPGGDDSCWGHHILIGDAEEHLHPQDEDWVWFVPHPGATYRIETTDLLHGADTTLELFRDCATSLAFDDDGGAGLASLVDYTATLDDFVIDVVIREFASSYTTREGYGLSVTCISGCPACAAPGGSYFELFSETVFDDHRIEACENVHVRDSVIQAGATAVLRAGDSVWLDNGTQVNGVLMIEIDPALQAVASPETAPPAPSAR